MGLLRLVAAVGALCLLAACGRVTGSGADSGFAAKVVTLPNGQKINAEVMLEDRDMMRGMMFRDSLAPDRGMLFVHPKPGNYSYWMYQVRIPLDIIWMDSSRRIVEISANTPPCTTAPRECPHYGGHAVVQYALELAGGMVEHYGLKEGQTLDF
ncbi:MAG: DUF192 domain-containing protein [Bryobacteraceae bacterium]